MKTIFTFLIVAIVAVLICDRYQDSKFILFILPVAVIGLGAILQLTDNRHYEIRFTGFFSSGNVKVTFYYFSDKPALVDYEVTPTRFRFEWMARLYAKSLSNTTLYRFHVLKINNQGETIEKTTF